MRQKCQGLSRRTGRTESLAFLTLVPAGGKRFPASLLWMQFFFSSMSIQNLPFHQNSPLRATVEAVPLRPLLFARPARPCVFGLKKRTSRPLVSRASARCAALRQRCLCARCALVPALSMSTALWIAFPLTHQPKSMSAASDAPTANVAALGVFRCRREEGSCAQLIRTCA